MPDDLAGAPAHRFEWEKAVRAATDLNERERLVGYALATWANGTGIRARPGIQKLAVATALPESTVRKHLRSLREKGYVIQVSSGSSFGLKDKTSEYRLALPGQRSPASGGSATTHRSPASAGSDPDQRSLAEGAALTSEQGSASQLAPTSTRPVQDQQPPPDAPAGKNERSADDPAREQAAAAIAAEIGCSPSQARAAVAELLAEKRGKPITYVAAYVRTTLDKNPDRLRRLIAALPAARRALPPECGQCEARPGDQPSARFLADGRPCPRCHPRTFDPEGGRRAS